MAIRHEGDGHFLSCSRVLANSRRGPLEERRLFVHLIESWIHEIDFLAWFEAKDLLELFRTEQQRCFIQQVLVS